MAFLSTYFKNTLKLIRYFLILLSYALFLPMVNANEDYNRENQLKSVYLVHFTELIRWPVQFSQAQTINICLYKDSQLQPFLEEFSNELIGDKPLIITLIYAVDQQQLCHIIYFNKPETSAVITMTIQNHPGALLVGNHQSFVDMGGAISFFTINNKIKFIINLKQTRQSGLKISSKLLRIARVIE